MGVVARHVYTEAKAHLNSRWLNALQRRRTSHNTPVDRFCCSVVECAAAAGERGMEHCGPGLALGVGLLACVRAKVLRNVYLTSAIRSTSGRQCSSVHRARTWQRRGATEVGFAVRWAAAGWARWRLAIVSLCASARAVLWRAGIAQWRGGESSSSYCRRRGEHDLLDIGERWACA